MKKIDNVKEFQMNLLNDNFNSLDFNRYFDFWHFHVNEPKAVLNTLEKRKESIHTLINIYNLLKTKMMSITHDYQLFILINETDYFQDSVYIHTQNPNADNFPLNLDENIKLDKRNELEEFIVLTGFEVIVSKSEVEKTYYLYDKSIGIPLINQE